MPRSNNGAFMKLRGRQRADMVKQIAKYRKDGHGIMEIVALLKLSKLAAVHDLYADGTQRQVKQILSQASLDAYVAFSDAMAIAQLYMETSLILMMNGELAFTPEQFGTHVRSTEHLAELFKLINGREVSMFKDANEEKKDPRLEKAKQRLKELETQALNGTTIEAQKTHVEEED